MSRCDRESFMRFSRVLLRCAEPPIDAAWNSVRLARYVLLRFFVHHENKKIGVSATFLRLGALSSVPQSRLMADFQRFHAKNQPLGSLWQLPIAKKLQSAPLFCF